MNLSAQAQLRPFLWTGLGWLGLSLTGLSALGAPEQRTVVLAWFVLFWLLAMLDLGTIAGLVFSIVSWEESSDRLRVGIRVGSLAVLKIALLVIFGGILFLKHGIPQSSLLVGLGTLIVVPLFGGLLWSFQGKPHGKD